MATPHVAGFAAYLLGLDNSLNSARIVAIINERALDDVITGVREFSSLHVGYLASEY